MVLDYYEINNKQFDKSVKIYLKIINKEMEISKCNFHFWDMFSQIIIDEIQ